jgi:predicted kinase
MLEMVGREDLNIKIPLYVLVGLPCSGKSTWAIGQQHTIADIVSLGTDDIIDQFARGISSTYTDAFKDTIDPATKMFEAFVTFTSIVKLPMIIDRTNMSKKSRARMLSLVTNKDKYDIHAVVFKVSDEVLNARLKARNEKGNKIITSTIIEQMKAKYQEPTQDEGFSTIIFYEPAEEGLTDGSAEAAV